MSAEGAIHLRWQRIHRPSSREAGSVLQTSTAFCASITPGWRPGMFWIGPSGLIDSTEERCGPCEPFRHLCPADTDRPFHGEMCRTTRPQAQKLVEKTI